jgi:hypothetical protein
MNMNTHRESWLAWILWSLVSLAVFAGFWFYLVFHRLLGLAVHRLVGPFVVLAFLVLCFAAAAKPSREKFINCGRVAPMMIAVLFFFLSACLWLVYYAQEFGYLKSSAALVLYIGLPIFLGLLGLLMVPLMPWMAREFMPREFRGAEDSGIRK